MRRAALACVSIALAACAPARAQPAPESAPVVLDGAAAGFDASACERSRGALTPPQAEACRAELRRRIEAGRARMEALREAARIAREAQVARRAPQLKPRDASIEFFLQERLDHGDVVMTDKGARVFVGRSYEPPHPDDFVTLDDPRSPHRARAAKARRAPM